MASTLPFSVPEQLSISGKVCGNRVRQLMQAASVGTIGAKRYNERGALQGQIARDGAGDFLVVNKAAVVTTDEFARVLLVAPDPTGSTELPQGGAHAPPRWLQPPPVSPGGGEAHEWARRCREVRESWRNQFSFKQEIREDGIVVELGLRPPQIGALHMALGHWKASAEPATIVMPTGTGKTETMLAVLVHERLDKLLVVVPTRALRDQTARKFETLGLLNELGVLGAQAAYPIVCTLEHRPRTTLEVDELFSRCNVIVSTMNIVGQCTSEVQAQMVTWCSHLFIDEAHHISASTWSSFRRTFLRRPILQFTATPFRTDGRHVDGKVIFNYPLRKAQEEGYFRPITFRSITEFSPGLADLAIAQAAITQLERDREAGYDHVVMARADSIERAKKIAAIYEAEAPDLAPTLLHSRMGDSERRAAMEALRSNAVKVVVCVDMLGEGFDFPKLKIAALHDIHKSLAITLQFTGRFTRTDKEIGEATIIANVADPEVNDALRDLYAESADWDVLLRRLSEGTTGGHVKKTEFLDNFVDPPPEVALTSIEPKMSAVVYRTECDVWHPERIADALGIDQVYAGPTLNPVSRVSIAITREQEPVRWGTIKELSNVAWHLYVVHWCPELQLLFINSSDNDSLHEGLAKAVGGEEVELIKGETVFRALHGITRLTLMNLGLSHTISRSIRFSMHVGADIGPAMADAAVQNKVKSNLFGVGYENGAKATIGCSQKGRVWSYQIAYDMSDWVDWCHEVGAKLTDPAISTEEPFRNLIVPKLITERPALVPLAIEWNEEFFKRKETAIEVRVGDQSAFFYDARLELVNHVSTGPIRFRVSIGSAAADYKLEFLERGIAYSRVGPLDAEISMGKRRESLSEWFRRYPPILFFENGSTLQSDWLFSPARADERAPFPVERIEALDWTGTDISVESQTSAKLAHSIQRRIIVDLLDPSHQPPWAVVFDDDDAYEAADIVAMRVEGDQIVVHLYHCKYSGEAKPGARLSDLYEVCGQAQRTVRWKADFNALLSHLRYRDARRIRESGVSRFEQGDLGDLASLEKQARLGRPRFSAFIVQPGLSKAQVSPKQLDLLAATELYLKETLDIDLRVIASA